MGDFGSNARYHSRTASSSSGQNQTETMSSAKGALAASSLVVFALISPVSEYRLNAALGRGKFEQNVLKRKII